WSDLVTAAIRRSVPLVLGIAAGAGLLLWIGPTFQGSAAALLCFAGAAGLHFSSRRGPGPAPCLRLVGRLPLPPRVELAVVETEGRHFLIAAGATVTLLPPGESR